MDNSKTLAENLLVEIRLKTPKVQILIGAASGIVAAIASIKIAESAALFLGAVMLLLSLTTDFTWNREINFNINFHYVNILIENNGPLATGFIAGYLIGFALI